MPVINTEKENIVPEVGMEVGVTHCASIVLAEKTPNHYTLVQYYIANRVHFNLICIMLCMYSCMFAYR